MEMKVVTPKETYDLPLDAFSRGDLELEDAYILIPPGAEILCKIMLVKGKRVRIIGDTERMPTIAGGILKLEGDDFYIHNIRFWACKLELAPHTIINSCVLSDCEIVFPKDMGRIVNSGVMCAQRR